MTFSQQYRDTLVRVLASVDLASVDRAIDIIKTARDEDRQIFVCGNGGSASTSSHFVCDMVKGASFDRPRRFRIMALTDSMATMSAYANDVGYEVVFAQQLRNFARPGDVLIAISGSGNSPNVIQAVQAANEIGCTTIGLSGRDGGRLKPLSQLSIHVNEPHMGRIEDAHMIICHMICYHFMELEAPAHS